MKCGDVIRLHHLATNKNLHSHHFSSPLSGNQEISAYGEDGNKQNDFWEKFNFIHSKFNGRLIGVGDSGDHWKVVCSDDAWLRSDSVKFHHTDTDVYLSVSGRTFGR